MTRAVPGYLNRSSASKEVTPGSKFGLCLDVWEADWKKDTARRRSILNEVTAIPAHAQKLVAALQLRQRALADQLPKHARFSLIGKAIAPFVTGLGNEHPLENGFAFLNPYGMPYLAGSGVKGVVRRAAEELASGEWGDATWTQADVWCLFGIDGEEWGKDNSNSLVCTTADVQTFLTPLDELARPKSPLKDIAAAVKDGGYSADAFFAWRHALHFRGLLRFWDTIPDCGKQLRVEIMTAHHSDYLGAGSPPHDSEQPNPILFLSVAPESSFNFIVSCDTLRLERLWPGLADRWQALLKEAFAHAFAWLGFGAKTRVGYGAMRLDKDAMTERDKALEDETIAVALAAMTPEQVAVHEFRKQMEVVEVFLAGGLFADQRNRFMKVVATWTNSGDKAAAIEVLRASARKCRPLDKKKGRELDNRISALESTS